MKRSEINRIITEMKEFCLQNRFMLPPWAFWSPQDWKGKADACREIVENGLGWDVSDFGDGRFDEYGITLFTIRNGNVKTGHAKTYAEKVLMVRENQNIPLHFHWKKMEDIIVRGGGNMVVEVFNSVSDDELNHEPVQLHVDGIKRTVEGGGKLVLQPGESVCMEPCVFHRFTAEPGSGTVLVGEVSYVSDEATDNNFYGDASCQPRFPNIEEDEAPLHLLCNDYQAYM
jgi:D-lyxose ketol-isomerase